LKPFPEGCIDFLKLRVLFGRAAAGQVRRCRPNRSPAPAVRRVAGPHFFSARGGSDNKAKSRLVKISPSVAIHLHQTKRGESLRHMIFSYRIVLPDVNRRDLKRITAGTESGSMRSSKQCDLAWHHFRHLLIRLRPVSQTSDQHARRSSIPSRPATVSHFASARRRIFSGNRSAP
jgi:hypothetical protein